MPKDLDIERTISFSYQAGGGNGNAVKLGGIPVDIPKGPDRKGYAKRKVEVRELLDGSWRVYYKPTLIAQTNATPLQRANPSKS